MKRLISVLLVVALLIPCVACADEIVIDLASATDSDLTSVRQMIQDEQVKRYKEKVANQHINADADGITFKGIPWYSTLAVAENIIGQVSKYRSACDLYRLGYIDYQYGSMLVADKVDGDLGCDLSYSGLRVAGYQPSSTRVCYIFPVVEGQIIRDFSLAEIYMGYYTFADDDYGNLSKVYDDLASKLEKLYGKGIASNDKYFASIIWNDQDGNIIRLQIDDDASYMTLAYVAATADQRLDEMAVAYLNEKTQAEDAIRYENVNNTEGL